MSIEQVLSGKVKLDYHTFRLRGHDLTFFIHYVQSTHNHYNNKLHKHSFHEVCYVIGGEGSYSEDGVDYPLSRGTVLLSRPGKWHQIKSASGLGLTWIGFEIVASDSDPEAANTFVRKINNSSKVCFTLPSDAPGLLLWDALLIELDSGQSLMEPSNLSHMHAIVNAFEKMFSDEGTAVDRKIGKSPSDVLYQATLFVRDNLSTPLRIEDVAMHLHISGRHLSRLFSQEMGLTYVGFVKSMRIKEAASLLRTSTVTIKEVAEETGFDNIHYFTRVFTLEMGISPAKYRKQHDSNA